MDFRPSDGPTKSWLSACPSVCLSIYPSVQLFPQEWHISFFWFWHNGNKLEYSITKTDFFFPGKFIFAQIWAKKAKMATLPQNRFLWIFRKILSLVFLGNNLKWKLILLLIFQHQPHSGKPLGLHLWAKMLSANETTVFFKMWYLKEEGNDELYFWHAEKTSKSPKS